jgi:hypothetical protein
MDWLRRLFVGFHSHGRRLALLPRDCPSCWRARAHALHRGRSRCDHCGKPFRARRTRSAPARLQEAPRL